MSKKKKKSNYLGVYHTSGILCIYSIFLAAFCNVNIYLFPLFNDFVQGHGANDRQNINPNSGLYDTEVNLNIDGKARLPELKSLFHHFLSL